MAADADDDQPTDNAHVGSGILRWAVRVVRRSSSLESLLALVALLTIALLWRMPLAVAVTTVLLFAASLAILVWELGADAYWTGRFAAERLILVSGAVVYFVVHGDVPGTAGAVFVGSAVISGAVVRGAMTRLARVPSVNLPGVATFAQLTRTNRVGHVLVGAAVVVVVWSAAAGLAWVSFSSGTFALLVAAAFVLMTLRNARVRRRATGQTWTQLEKLAPQFYLHWDAPSEGTYQVTMWLPYLKRIGVPFAVIVRTTNQLRALSRVVDVPVVYCSSMKDVDRTVFDSVRTVFFVNTALRNAHYLRFNHLRCVQLNHGDSDKPASASRQFRAYDLNFVAGRAAVDRFASHGIEVPETSFRIVGRPQVEPIARRRASVRPHPTVLYAPTWGGFFADSDLCSLPIGMGLVECLLERRCRVIFRPHPFTDRNEAHAKIAADIRELLARDTAAGGEPHVFGGAAELKMSIFDCFDQSDVMIADVSSIVTDYLFSEKPLIMTAVNTPVSSFGEVYPVSRAAYVLDAAAPDFDGALDRALGADPLRVERLRVRDYYLSDAPAEGYSDVFVAAARAVVVGL